MRYSHEGPSEQHPGDNGYNDWPDNGAPELYKYHVPTKPPLGQAGLLKEFDDEARRLAQQEVDREGLATPESFNSQMAEIERFLALYYYFLGDRRSEP